MQRLVIGLDFGSLSARGILVDAADGRLLGEATFDYPHGIMEQALPSGQALPAGFALQHPQDFVDALHHLFPALLRENGVKPAQVAGIGLCATACSVLPVDAKGQALCLQTAWQDEPQAYLKMWKHQADQPQADRMTALALQRGAPWLKRYGGILSSTWLHPKLLALHEGCPALVKASDHYLELADWLTMQLTGYAVRNACAAGYKALHGAGLEAPDEAFFEALSPGFGREAARLTRAPLLPQGARAGGLTAAMAAQLGLMPGTAVAVAMVDAHAGMLGAGLQEPGEMHSILGTSGCHMLLAEEQRAVPGICGVVKDGILPGYYAYEAGQVSFGDHLDWLVSRLLRAEPQAHERLSREAARLKPGQTGLLALDWWNGNRSVLVDSRLRGLLLGLSLQTSDADIYRALLEALALSTRLILDTFTAAGLAVDRLSASGGISQKNPLAMQILADALGLPVRVPLASQGGALGSAMLATAAAGTENGGCDSLQEAVRRLQPQKAAVYQPNPAHAKAYATLYQEYRRLHDHFGRGENEVMKTLLQLKAAQEEAPRA